MEIVRFAVGALLLVASALLAVQLWNGRWQFLVARPERTKKGTFFPAGTRETGRHLSWVMVACFAVVATLMASEMGRLAGSALFVQAGFVVSGVALLAYGGCIVWTVACHCKVHGRPYFAGGSSRLAVTLAATCIVLTALSLLFA